MHSRERGPRAPWAPCSALCRAWLALVGVHVDVAFAVPCVCSDPLGALPAACLSAHLFPYYVGWGASPQLTRRLACQQSSPVPLVEVAVAVAVEVVAASLVESVHLGAAEVAALSLTDVLEKGLERVFG